MGNDCYFFTLTHEYRVVVEILIPVGPKDRADWVEKAISSAVKQGRVVVYDNSEREDLSALINKYNVKHVKAPRLKRVNMAKLRNEMLKYASDRFVIFLDSDVVLPEKGAEKMESSLKRGFAFTWMHYAYSEEEIDVPLSPGEENPNLGCAALDLEALRKVGMFDERYERDEDVWVYSKLKKVGFRVGPTEGRCLHLNKVHSREDLTSSLEEAKRNLWRSKYDMMLVLDGMTDVTFLTGYGYYGMYYLLGIAGVFFYPVLLGYVPLVVLGIRYYRDVRKFFYNLIPGLALAVSLPYGLVYAYLKGRRREESG